jgi:hypothetical protein
MLILSKSHQPFGFIIVVIHENHAVIIFPIIIGRGINIGQFIGVTGNYTNSFIPPR